MGNDANRAVPSKALLALVELWDLMECVPEQNGTNWDQSLAEQHDAVLMEAWQIMLTLEDEIKACKANAPHHPSGCSGVEPR